VISYSRITVTVYLTIPIHLILKHGYLLDSATIIYLVKRIYIAYIQAELDL